mgnify:CR=1 FL=1
MKVVVDTNVVVSAIIRDRDFEGARQVMKTKILSVTQFNMIVGQIIK